MIHDLLNDYRVIDPWFDRERTISIELDMGCGNGAFLLALARRYPNRLFLGSDVHSGRLRKTDRRTGRHGLRNVELLMAGNLNLAGYLLPDACISRLHILCPDPWPKVRHHYRRLVNSDFLWRAARILKPGGVMHLATDDPDYYEWLNRLVPATPFFRPAREAVADIADLKTDFEQIWLNLGRMVPHLAFICNK